SHLGVDIAASHGSPIVAAEAGTVVSAGYQGGYGLCVDINHGGGVVTRYAHLSSSAVKSGQSVERGQFVGRAGSTGNSTGPHLHFEVIVNGVHKNPSLFI
ncbi:MAG: M23 family metallopeptidase, partial [Desulfotomaculaceae bacterium]